MGCVSSKSVPFEGIVLSDFRYFVVLEKVGEEGVIFFYYKKINFVNKSWKVMLDQKEKEVEKVDLIMFLKLKNVI